MFNIDVYEDLFSRALPFPDRIFTPSLMASVTSLNTVGVVSVAVSTSLVAARKELDVFCFILLSCITGVGGGTWRDLLLGRTPVFWIKDNTDILVAGATGLLTFIVLSLLMTRYPEKILLVTKDPEPQMSWWMREVFLWTDNIGLSTWCVLGSKIAFDRHVGNLPSIVCGVFTACFGGFTRDILAGDKPTLYCKELYATCAFFGACVHVLFLHNQWANETTRFICAFFACFLLRGVAMITRLSLPRITSLQVASMRFKGKRTISTHPLVDVHIDHPGEESIETQFSRRTLGYCAGRSDRKTEHDELSDRSSCNCLQDGAPISPTVAAPLANGELTTMKSSMSVFQKQTA